MSKYRFSVTDGEGMQEIIRQNPSNSYLEKLGRGPEKPDNPLPMLNVRPECDYVVATDEAGLIVGAATLYSLKAGEQNFRDEAALATTYDRVFLSQLSVNQNHRRQGIAKSILGAVFELAADQQRLLTISGFEDDGKAGLCPILPDVHKKFADVSVIYYGSDHKVTGNQDYVLKPNTWNVFVPCVT